MEGDCITNLSNMSDLTTCLVESRETDDEISLSSAIRHSNYHDIDGLLAHICENEDIFASQLKVMHFNVQSLSSKLISIQNVLTRLEDRDIILDCILLCETFLHENNVQLAEIPGYNLVSKHRSNLKRGGVAIYIRNELSYKVKEDVSTFIEGQFESVFIEIDVENSKTIVGEIYRIPNSDPHLSLQRFDYIFSKLHNFKNVVIGTDQNFDLLKVNAHKNTSDLLDSAFANGLIPTITKPTRITHTSATLIDNIYVKHNKQHKVNSAILVSDMSDHLPVFCFINSTAQRQQPKSTTQFQCRKLTNTQFLNIKQSLDTINWNEELCDRSADDACDHFIHVLNTVINIHAPLKTINIPKRKIIREPWMTPALIKSSNKCLTLYKQSVGKSKTDPAYKKYILYRNVYNRLKTDTRKQYYAELMNNYKGDMKKTWGVINNVLGRNNNKTSPAQVFMNNDTEISDDNIIAEEFCKYFTEIGPKFANAVDTATNDAKHYLQKNKQRNKDSFFLSPTDPNEILRILNKCKPKTSKGHDNISTKLLKCLGTSVCLPLSIVINKSLANGKVPDSLKLAKVIAIHKSKSKDEFTNYRPISLLPSVSKLLEKIVHKRLMFFFESYDLLYDNQYGFRPNRSTVDAVTKLLTDINSSLNNNNMSLSVFLDLSKAFDTIDHNILLNKLNFYGIRGIAYDWFRDYLTNRRQYVEYRGARSTTQNITCGVPQGSVLGPLLFIIYTNDLPDALTHAKSILFADDTTLYISDNNLNRLYTEMNEELDVLTDWFKANKLSLNISKTKYMLFSNILNLKEPTTLCLSGVTIESCHSMKFLGIFIDDKLKWDSHINYVSKKVSNGLFAINKAKQFLPEQSLVSIYYTLIYPHLSYGITMWGGAHSIYTNKLIIQQKKLIRSISGAPFNAHTEPLFKKLRLYKFIDIYNIHVSKYVHAFLLGKLPPALSNIFVVSNEVHHHRTRHSMQMKLIHYKYKNVVTGQSLLRRGPEIWNNLLSELYLNSDQTLRSKKSFSSRVGRHVLRGYIDR